MELRLSGVARALDRLRDHVILRKTMSRFGPKPSVFSHCGYAKGNVEAVGSSFCNSFFSVGLSGVDRHPDRFSRYAEVE